MAYILIVSEDDIMFQYLLQLTILSKISLKKKKSVVS